MEKISYIIENGKIKLENSARSFTKGSVKVYDNRIDGIGFLHMKGNATNKINTVFQGSPGNGMILSVQTLLQNTRFEFESTTVSSINFAPIMESIQMMLTDVSFGYSYDTPGVLNRIDIYIPKEKLATLLPEKLLAQLRKHQMLDLSVATIKFLSPLNEFLNALISELEKPASDSLHAYFESFLQSVTS